jgi:mitogen-activated protein kinase 15
MLISKPMFPGASTMNQLERVIQLIGKPSTEDTASIHSVYAETILESVNPTE